MLINGAIIARELGIPCVNGVPSAVELIEEGELACVDGHLGVVTPGTPDLRLEGIGSESLGSEVKRA
jgi:pyruvate,water dikinase